jgi:hypothetical protein
MPRWPSLNERLWGQIEVRGPDDCWPWKGSVVTGGYGEIVDNHRRWRTHRLVYSLEIGPIPVGLGVLHTCDNPPCCNPAHLHAGTKIQNMQEAVARRRISRGETRWNAKLSPATVRAIRAIASAGGTTHTAIGQRFGVSRAAVGYIVQRKRWAWVD